MKEWLLLVLVQTWLSPGLALYHERSMTTLKSPNTNQSYFGFSVAYLSGIPDKRLIVGAPRGNDIGQVFSCNIDTRNCTSIPLSVSRIIDVYKHDYWLGATVKSTPSYFYTCAPRSVSSVLNNKYGSAGTCLKVSIKDFASSVMTSISDEERERNSLNKTERASDTFGWSMEISPDKKLLIGGPAMYTGRVSIHSGFSHVTGLTGEQVGVNFNFGYSIAVGDFYTPKTNTFAIGSPYGKNGFGKVVIYTNNNIKPMQKYQLEPKNEGVGSMFGAVLCSAHMSGPGKTAALIVGAPAHAHGREYNVGAVYVFVRESWILKEVRVLKGATSGAQFGSAITNVGDLNGDHRDELAIAAPFEVDGRGAVYVYSGAEVVGELTNLTPLQRLEPQPGIERGFGLALATMPDYDRNGCNELIVGSPFSESVSLLRCFASVILEVYAVFPELKGHNTSSFQFDSCIKVTYPAKPEKVLGRVKVTLSIIHSHARLANPIDSEYIVSLEDKGQINKCRKVEVSTPEGNYATLIGWKMSAAAVDNPLEDKVFDPSRMLISRHSVMKRSGSLWAAECSTAACEPKLSLEIHTKKRMDESNPYLIGSSDSEVFSVVVSNSGDTAYESCVRVRVTGANLVTGSKTDCSRADAIFTCKPTRPLKNNESWPHNDITLDMRKLTNMDTEILIIVDLYPRCDGSNKTEYSEKIYLKNDTNIIVTGRTSPDDVIKITKKEMSFEGKAVEHIYTIENSGVTRWMELGYTVRFIRKPFIKLSVVTEFEGAIPNAQIACFDNLETKEEITVSCRIKELKKKGKIDIIVPVYIIPGKLDGQLNEKNFTIDSILHLDLKEIPPQRISSKLVLSVAVVPLFVIVAAICLGLLLVGILAWALYECGFLKRKNQENLKELKKDIRRQTIRRSMINETRRQLDGAPEENEATCTIETSAEADENSFKKSTEVLVRSK